MQCDWLLALLCNKGGSGPILLCCRTWHNSALTRLVYLCLLIPIVTIGFNPDVDLLCLYCKTVVYFPLAEPVNFLFHAGGQIVFVFAGVREVWEDVRSLKVSVHQFTQNTADETWTDAIQSLHRKRATAASAEVRYWQLAHSRSACLLGILYSFLERVK